MRAEASILVTGARVWTDGALLPGADAIAIVGDRVHAVGRAHELEPLAGARTRRLDARGCTVTPGLTDAHLHVVEWARALEEIPLADAASRAEVLERVRAWNAAHPGAAPVVGRGWDDRMWDAPPERDALDAVSGGRVVLLHRRDFHALWVNSAALARAGVTRATADPAGGRFVRDAAGEPTGLVQEHAVRAFRALVDQARAGDDLARVRAAVARLHRAGITAVHDFEDAGAHRILRAMAESDGPRVRVLMHLPQTALDHALALGLASGLGDDRFRIGSIKLFADGTLGSRTAAMLEPYEGTDTRGMVLLARDEIARLVARAAEGGLATAIHAIGDAAVRAALDAFEAAGELVRRPVLVPRIEHAQLVHQDDLPRFAALGVAASMQPAHAVSDTPLARRFWGARVANSYPWCAVLASGARLAFGSDAPVEPPSCALGLHAAIARRPPGAPESEAFVPGQRLSLDQAITAYTEGPARLAGWWPRLGRLVSGARADLVVWDADLHALAPDALAAAGPALTVLDGEIVYRALPTPPPPGASSDRPSAVSRIEGA